jgi:hypothetical protein
VVSKQTYSALIRLTGRYGPYLSVALIARVLSMLALLLCMLRFAPDVVGEFAYAVVTASLLATILGLGIDVSINASSSSANGNDRGEIWKAGALQAFASAGAIYGVAFLFSHLGIFPEAAAALVGVITTLATIHVFFGFVAGLLFSTGANKAVARCWLVTSASFFLLAAVLPRSLDAETLLFAYLCSYCVGLILSVYALGLSECRRLFGRPNAQTFSALRQLTSFGSRHSAVSASMAAALWVLQTQLVATGGGKAEMAIYALGMQLYNAVIFAPIALSPLLLRKISAKPSEAEMIIHRVRPWIFASAALVSLLAFHLAHSFLHYLPEIYTGATLALALAAGSAAVHFCKSPFSVYFQAKLKSGPEAIGVLIGVAAMLLICMSVPIETAARAHAARLLIHGLQVCVVFGAFFWFSSKGRKSSIS